MENKTVSAYFLRSEETFYYGDGHASMFDTKTKGFPYLPENEKVPLDASQKPMSLLFQINFDEMPNTPGFPEKGIMQIFIANGDAVVESGIFDSADVCVRFFDSVDYSIDDNNIDDNCPLEDDTFFSINEARYWGSGASLELFGDDITVPLGSPHFNGIIVGGTMDVELLSENNRDLIEAHPEHIFPLLRINDSENIMGDLYTNYYILVSKKEFEMKRINRVLVLFDSEWAK